MLLRSAAGMLSCWRPPAPTGSTSPAPAQRNSGRGDGPPHSRAEPALRASAADWLPPAIGLRGGRNVGSDAENPTPPAAQLARWTEPRFIGRSNGVQRRCHYAFCKSGLRLCGGPRAAMQAQLGTMSSAIWSLGDPTKNTTRHSPARPCGAERFNLRTSGSRAGPPSLRAARPCVRAHCYPCGLYISTFSSEWSLVPIY